MTDGAGDDEEMPGKMCVADAMSGKESDTCGIGDAAGQKPGQA